MVFNMNKLSREDLMSLETYSDARDEFRKKVMAHKKNRRLPLGLHATLYFEDRLTMQYQIQEMLRIEKIFKREDILEELETYNALIPDGNNLKATLMFEYEDADERKIWLRKLVNAENHVYLKINGCAPIYAIANEDLPRSTDEKTSAVHFLRFEFDETMKKLFLTENNISFGIDQEHYHEASRVKDPLLSSLRCDLSE
jgi:hypothetical protein